MTFVETMVAASARDADADVDAVRLREGVVLDQALAPTAERAASARAGGAGDLGGSLGLVVSILLLLGLLAGPRAVQAARS